MPHIEDIDKEPCICLDPGMGTEDLDFFEIPNDAMPFARAAVRFVTGQGPLEDVIAEGRELEALREWRALREKQRSGAPEPLAAR